MGIIPVIINHKNKFPVGYINRKTIKLTKNTISPSLILFGVTKNLYIPKPNRLYIITVVKK